jgi:hypothetical protein
VNATAQSLCPDPSPDPDRIALGVRQPWAELILRGVKTIEVRSQDTRQRGTIYLYASKKVSELPAARRAAEQFDLDLDLLPRGLVVGTIEILRTAATTADDAAAACVPAELLTGQFGWHLDRPFRFPQPLTVDYLPYGVWFYPWKRRTPHGPRRTGRR